MGSTNKERVLEYVWAASPGGATNGEIQRGTGITSVDPRAQNETFENYPENPRPTRWTDSNGKPRSRTLARRPCSAA
jgi:hypothetical protein